jgi:hypothetical protein
MHKDVFAQLGKLKSEASDAGSTTSEDSKFSENNLICGHRSVYYGGLEALGETRLSPRVAARRGFICSVRAVIPDAVGPPDDTDMRGAMQKEHHSDQRMLIKSKKIRDRNEPT